MMNTFQSNNQQGRFQWHAKGDAPTYRRVDGQFQAVLLLFTHNPKRDQRNADLFLSKNYPGGCLLFRGPAPEVPKA
jgi:hypothetical protein